MADPTSPGAVSPVRIVDPMDAATRRRYSEARIEIVRVLIARAGGHAALLASRTDVAWLTAGGQHHVVTSSETGVGAMLITDRAAWFLAPNIERERLADEELAGLGLDVVAYDWWEDGGLERCARRLLGRPSAVGDLLGDADLEPALVAHRSHLDAGDQERLTVLGRAAAGAVDGALAWIDVGAREEELGVALLGQLVGLRAPVVLVAADERIARYRHPLPTALPIRERVMLVLVAEAWGLHVALTRFRGWRDDPRELTRRWNAVRVVHQAMIDASVPGATLGSVFGVAQRGYADQGFPDAWREHHQGGTIGYQARERVAIPGDPTMIAPGMALAWNPSIAGVKVEDTVIIGADGSPRVVTSLA